jgi:RNA polymerase sigma-70 factor (ECF subfamily)
VNALRTERGPGMLGTAARRPRSRARRWARVSATVIWPVRISQTRCATPMDTKESVTDLLLRAHAGEPGAADRIFPLVYDELRRLAHRQLQREATGHTLATTDLVHEAYFRLVEQTRVQWSGRAHFMAVAASAMRRILVDHARNHGSLKRGGGLRRMPIDSIDMPIEERAELLVALDDALDRLRRLDERRVRVVECRFFGGMTEEETAEALGIGLRTAKRDWAKAKSWLYNELYPEPSA